MGQKQVKRYRGIAQKVAKAEAVSLAESQIRELMLAPWSFRWKYCKQILFPPKAIRKLKKSDIIESARGLKAGSLAVAQAEVHKKQGEKNNGSQ